MLWTRIVNIFLVIVSVIFGFIIASLFAHGLLIAIRTSVKINLIFSVILLLAYVGALAISYFLKNPKIKMFLINPGITVLLSSIGSAVASVLALAVIIVPTSSPIVILVGFIGFFFWLMVLSFTYLVICIARRTKLLPDIL